MPTTDWPEEMLTIEPPPAATMWGIPYLQLQNTFPVSALSKMRFHSSVVYSTSRLMFEPTSVVGAALFTSTVSEPKRSTTASMTEATLSSLVTSSSKNSASPPTSLIKLTTFWPRATVRPVTATLAPSRANISAIVRPMPLVEPETSATLPSSRMVHPAGHVRPASPRLATLRPPIPVALSDALPQLNRHGADI